ncbi:hypothetical protein FDF74_04795 [Clostridium niameyense]|uniref:Uncharacterized protein n=1 Tax=Clostridium niameyense TaxID=1622073 RepID=A0A6M0R8G3_9CLOT|nr:hypothetical protein [Clostridium niameyense]NEZ46533.1 hypothetical protein [Clostridium niameyense]
MIQNISSSKLYSSTNKLIDKNITKQNNKPKFKKYLSYYVPEYTGNEGFARKHNYKKMTIFEKRLFDTYMRTNFYGVSYDDFKKHLIGFPPVDAPKYLMEAYINTISSYPENQRKKIMGQLSSLDAPTDKVDMKTILNNAIEHCTLVEILIGQSQEPRKNLYKTFLHELEKVRSIDK